MILEHCKGVHCVDLGEIFQTHILYLLAKLDFDTAENEPSNACPTPRRRGSLGARRARPPRARRARAPRSFRDLRAAASQLAVQIWRNCYSKFQIPES